MASTTATINIPEVLIYQVFKMRIGGDTRAISGLLKRIQGKEIKVTTK